MTEHKAAGAVFIWQRMSYPKNLTLNHSLSSSVEQQLDRGLVSVPGGPMQRGPFSGVLGLNVSPSVKQQLDRGHASVPGSRVQRCRSPWPQRQPLGRAVI